MRGLLALMLSGCAPAAGIGGLTVVADGRHVLGPGAVVYGMLAVGGGSADLGPGATVAGDVYLLAGELRIGGSVEGDVTAVGGSLAVGPSAHITGVLRTGGGVAAGLDQGARIDGGIEEGAGLPVGQPPADAVASVASLLIRVGGLVVLALGVRQLARAPVARAGRYLATMPAAALAYGFLVAVVGLSLAVFMAFTLVLIPVAILALIGLVAAVVVGLAGLLDALGARFGSVRAMALVTVLLVLGPLVPLVGQWLVGGILLAALGAAALAAQRPTAAPA